MVGFLCNNPISHKIFKQLFFLGLQILEHPGIGFYGPAEVFKAQLPPQFNSVYAWMDTKLVKHIDGVDIIGAGVERSAERGKGIGIERRRGDAFGDMNSFGTIATKFL